MTQPGWAGRLLAPILKQNGGQQQQPQPYGALNIIGASVVANAATGDLDVTIPSAGAGGQGNSLLASGLNSNITPAAGIVQRVYGPTAAFSIGGWNDSPSGGQERTVINTTAYTLTIVNEDSATGATGRIDTQSSGAPIVLQAKSGSVVLKYDTTDPGGGGATGRWVVQNVGVHRPIKQNVKDYGARGDGQLVIDASITSGLSVVTSPSALFAPGDVGKLATICDLGSVNRGHGVITHYTSATQVTVSFTGGATITGTGLFTWGTDDSTSVAAAIAAAITLSNTVATTAPEVFFPAGQYCTSAGFNLTVAHHGMRMVGAGAVPGNPVPPTTSRIVAMAPMAYLVNQSQSGIKAELLWFAGNRLATEAYQWSDSAGSTARSVYRSCIFDGGANDSMLITGTLEIDNMAFYDCYAEGDSQDATYFPARAVCRNENPQAFQFTWYGGAFIGGSYLLQFGGGGSFSLSGGTQLLSFGNAAIQVQSNAASFTLDNVYTESSTNYFIRVDATSGSTGIGVALIRNSNLGPSPIYSSHQMKIDIEHCVLGANIYSDPGAGNFNGLVFGNQPITVRDSVIASGAGVVTISGVAGQLVHFEDCIYQGLSSVTPTDGVVSGSALSFASSTPLSKQIQGAPIQIAGAGPSGGVYNGWLNSVTNSGAGTIDPPAPTAIASGAHVTIWNVGWGNGVEYFQPTSFTRSPGKMVSDNTTLAALPQFPARQATHGYTAFDQQHGQITAGNYNYIATTTGTTGGGSPSFPSDFGATVVDGGVTWKNTGPKLASTYDANGLMLGVGVAPMQSGTIIAGDWHVISGLNANRSYGLSIFGVSGGNDLDVTNADTTYTVTLTANGTTIAALGPGQWVRLTYEPSSTWTAGPIQGTSVIEVANSSQVINDYAAVGSTIAITNSYSGTWFLTGFAPPAGAKNGQAIEVVFNCGGQSVTLSHDNTGSAVGNRVYNPTNGDVVLTAPAGNGFRSAKYVYRTATSHWHLVRYE